MSAANLLAEASANERSPRGSSDHESALRSRLAAAADYGRRKIVETASPCSRDLCWYLIRLDALDLDASELEREVRAAEHLWRAALEVERFERCYCGGAAQ